MLDDPFSNTITSTNIIFSIILLLLLSAFFSACEAAIISTPKFKWVSSKFSRKNKTINKIINKILDNYSISLATILIGNTIVNVAASTIVSTFFVSLYGDWIIGIITGVLTFIILIFCEYLPKNLSKSHGINLLYYLSFPLYFFWILLWPISYSFNFIFRKNKIKTASERDISFLIKAVESEGTLEQTEAVLINNALNFDETKVKQIYKNKFISVKKDNSILEALKIYHKHPYSRFPVLDSKGNVIGILNFKDLLKVIGNDESKNLKVKDIMSRTILFSYLDETLDTSLRTMQRFNIHMAIIKKNKRSTKPLGIITIEMILEELVGEIYDEKDNIKAIKKVNKYTWITDPSVEAKYFFDKQFEIPLEVKSNITLNNYFKKIFKVTRFKINQSFQNDELKISIIKSSNNDNKKYLFEINEKTNKDNN